jgi:hypothetical protein
VVARVGWDFVLDEVPAEAEDLVVAEVFFRLIPGEEPAVGVDNRRMPRELGVDVGGELAGLRAERRAKQGAAEE